MKALPAAFILVCLASCMFAPETPLQRAAARNDVTEIEALVKNGVDLNQEGAHGIVAIASAARNGAVDAIRALGKHGAGTNTQSGVNGWTPLQQAIHKNRVESVRALLDAGADVNGRGRNGGTPLMMAAGYGYAHIVEVLLDRGADAYAHLDDGRTALSMAVLGTTDIDRITVADCQTATVKLLVNRVPGLKLASGESSTVAREAAAKLKRCAGLADVVRGVQ